jgi:N utilization substance protein A
MFDLKVIHSVLDQMEDERGISRAKMLDAIEQALATAYKKEFGKRGQIIRARFDLTSGKTDFDQIKIVVDETMIRMEELPTDSLQQEDDRRPVVSMPEEVGEDGDIRVRFDPEKHSSRKM